jgi:hypothetical protein
MVTGPVVTALKRTAPTAATAATGKVTLLIFGPSPRRPATASNVNGRPAPARVSAVAEQAA